MILQQDISIIIGESNLILSLTLSNFSFMLENFDVASVEGAFNAADADGNGTIDADELVNGIDQVLHVALPNMNCHE